MTYLHAVDVSSDSARSLRKTMTKLLNREATGLDVTIGNCTYDPDCGEFVYKLTVKIKGSKSKEETDLHQLIDNGFKYDLESKQFLEKIGWCYLVGYNRKGRRFKFIVERENDGQRFNIPEDRANRLFLYNTQEWKNLVNHPQTVNL